MQSKSSSFLRRILSSPHRTKSGDNDPIGGSAADLAMSAIETSLTILKEASALASKVPYIAPIASILLEALKMREEVKMLKGEWGVVMRKLAEVGNVLVDVGEWYQANNMNEWDLPSDLRNILKSLQTDLDGIQDVLEECTKVKGIRRFLLRADMLESVRRYDARLTHAVQVCQVRMALGSRLAQIVQERKTNYFGQTAASVDSIIQTETAPAVGSIKKRETAAAVGSKKKTAPAVGSKKKIAATVGPKKKTARAVSSKKKTAPTEPNSKTTAPAVGSKKMTAPAVGSKKKTSPAVGSKRKTAAVSR